MSPIRTVRSISRHPSPSPMTRYFANRRALTWKDFVTRPTSIRGIAVGRASLHSSLSSHSAILRWGAISAFRGGAWLAATRKRSRIDRTAPMPGSCRQSHQTNHRPRYLRRVYPSCEALASSRKVPKVERFQRDRPACRRSRTLWPYVPRSDGARVHKLTLRPLGPHLWETADAPGRRMAPLTFALTDNPRCSGGAG